MVRFADMVYLTASHWIYYPRNSNSMENSIVYSNFRVDHLNILHITTVVLLCLVQKHHNGMKGSRFVEKINDFPLNFNLEGKSLVECAPLMFKTYKMGIRYLNGALFSNETRWREDMFWIVYDFYVKAVHCEKNYRDTGMWLPGHGATDDIIFWYHMAIPNFVAPKNSHQCCPSRKRS